MDKARRIYYNTPVFERDKISSLYVHHAELHGADYFSPCEVRHIVAHIILGAIAAHDLATMRMQHQRSLSPRPMPPRAAEARALAADVRHDVAEGRLMMPNEISTPPHAFYFASQAGVHRCAQGHTSVLVEPLMTRGASKRPGAKSQKEFD